MGDQIFCEGAIVSSQLPATGNTYTGLNSCQQPMNYRCWRTPRNWQNSTKSWEQLAIMPRRNISNTIKQFLYNAFFLTHFIKFIRMLIC